MVEPAVGQRTAEAVVEEQEQERHLHTFGGEAVGVAGAIALQEPMAFQLAEIVAELVPPVGFGRESKRGEDGLVGLLAVQPPTVVPPCKRTSIRRMIRVSWILIPG